MGVAQWSGLEPMLCERFDARVSVEFLSPSGAEQKEAIFDMYGDMYLESRRMFPFVAEADLGRLAEGLAAKAQEQLRERLRASEQCDLGAVIGKRGGPWNALGFASAPGVCWFTLTWEGDLDTNDCLAIVGEHRRAFCDEMAALVSTIGEEWTAVWPGGGRATLNGGGPDEFTICPAWPAFGCTAKASSTVPATVDALALVMHRHVEEEAWASLTASPSDRGIEDFACPNHPMVQFARAATAFAQALDDDKDPGLSSIDPNATHMTARANRRLLNFLCGGRGTALHYLEIGALRGSSLAACLDGNRGAIDHAHTVDSFVAFDGGPAFVHEAARRHAVPYTLHETDFRDADLVADLARRNHFVDVYLYDGPHAEADHADAFLLFDPVFEPTFFAVIDDWNLPQVRAGTKRAFDVLNYTTLYQRRVVHRPDGRHSWHNGIAFFLLRKPGYGNDCASALPLDAM